MDDAPVGIVKQAKTSRYGGPALICWHRNMIALLNGF